MNCNTFLSSFQFIQCGEFTEQTTVWEEAWVIIVIIIKTGSSAPFFPVTTHTAGRSIHFWPFSKVSINSDWVLQQWSMRNVFESTKKNNQNICLLSNIELFYMRESRNFSSFIKDVSDIQRFPTKHMVKPHFLFGISVNIRAIQNIIAQYNFWDKCIGYLSLLPNTCAAKYIFSQTTIIKPNENWLKEWKTVRNGFSSCRVLHRSIPTLWRQQIIASSCDILIQHF